MTIVLTTFVSIVGSYYLQEKRINETMDDLLVEVGLIFNKMARAHNFYQETQENKHIRLTRYIADLNRVSLKNKGKYLFQARDQSGNFMGGLPSYEHASLIGKAGFSDKYINGKKWRVFTAYNTRDNYVFALAEDYDFRYIIFKNLIRDGIFLILLIYTTSGFCIWLLMNSALKRIRSFANEVSTREANRLDPISTDKVPIEILPLADELNQLLARLHQAFEREKQFSGDAAHELHTPLAALRTHAQVALKTTDPVEIHGYLQKVILSVDRCAHVVQQLLTLYRLTPETITEQYFSSIDLETIAADVIYQSSPSAMRKQIQIKLSVPQKLGRVNGNVTALHILLRNLVDNAIRYSPKRSCIDVVIQNLPDEIMLSVIDHGAGIPEELQTQVLQRFFRILGSRVQGTGLGLAIVDQIAKLHQASLQLKTSPGGGLTVEVKFRRKKNGF